MPSSKLGEYIETIDERNKEQLNAPLLGVSIKKELIPSIANTIGTDMTSYKILRRGQFAYGPVTSRNGDKISIAMLQDYDSALVSQAYTVFRVIDKERLDPNFLMLWFNRSEFDRYARFKSHGSAREIFSWEEMCDTYIPIPSISTQRRIVKLFSKIDSLLNNYKQENEQILRFVDALFMRDFKTKVHGNKYIGDYLTPKRGKNLLTKDAAGGTIPVVAGGIEPSAFHNKANTKAPVITISASGANAGFINIWEDSVWASDSSFIDSSITESIYFWYACLRHRQNEIYETQIGSAQAHVYPQHIAKLDIGDIPKNEITNFSNQVSMLFEKISKNNKESNKLLKIRNDLLPVLLSKKGVVS